MSTRIISKMQAALLLAAGVLIATTTAAETDVKLFGVSLSDTDIHELADAIQKAGGKYLKDDSTRYSRTYDSQALFEGSSVLEVNHLQNGRIAYAQYLLPLTEQNFHDLDRTHRLATMLATKYGPPDKGSLDKPRQGPGPRLYQWQRGGVQIDVVTPWPPLVTSIRYTVVANMVRYEEERAAAKASKIREKADQQKDAF